MRQPPPLLAGECTTAAYARLLPMRGHHLSAASACRRSLPPSRSLLLACGRYSVEVLPQPLPLCNSVAVTTASSSNAATTIIPSDAA
ncbi:hypothetical protein B296_00018734 [Ensete ventricosum]|uniref:Uncharacterized protein n=1 Tax=Ensete ventricosum TaxID=4639 RepID=A0A427AYA1_ENSVE|nr:hypothetical protein B296_00018734 [Ensete ventricosum]